MFTIANILTLIRAPLALLFLNNSVIVRVVVIIAAMVSDGLDGYFARRCREESTSGKFLDPALDKFFVFFVLAVLVAEHQLTAWEMTALVFRDLLLCALGLYISLFGDWMEHECKSVRLSKITTAFQFAIILGLSMGVIFPGYVYNIFVVLGVMSIVELFLGQPRSAI